MEFIQSGHAISFIESFYRLIDKRKLQSILKNIGVVVEPLAVLKEAK